MKKVTVWVVFLLAALLFFFRGPYRALRGPSLDFGVIYSAARCWIAGENPYDNEQMDKKFISAGGPANRAPTDKLPSVYAPAAMPFFALDAWLPWPEALWAWCAISVAAFALSLFIIFRDSGLAATGKWLLGSAILAYSPVHTGLAMGTPSVIACSLVAIAIYLALAERPVASGIVLGVAHSIKPQLSICAVAVLAIWKLWTPLLISVPIPLVATALSVARAQSIARFWQWCLTWRDNVALTFAAGHINDPSPSNFHARTLLNTDSIVNLLVPDTLTARLIVWITGLTLLICYLYLRKRVPHDRPWRDIAFFTAWTMLLIYHRYYEGQLLLLIIPFVLKCWRSERRIAISLCVCLLVLAFPSQTALSVWSGLQHSISSVSELILFRHQPLAVLVMSFLLVPWSARNRRNENPNTPKRIRYRLDLHQQAPGKY